MLARFELMKGGMPGFSFAGELAVDVSMTARNELRDKGTEDEVLVLRLDGKTLRVFKYGYSYDELVVGHGAGQQAPPAIFLQLVEPGYPALRAYADGR